MTRIIFMEFTGVIGIAGCNKEDVEGHEQLKGFRQAYKGPEASINGSYNFA
jgi:hypothetical protein